jgi:hypothetical protein
VHKLDRGEHTVGAICSANPSFKRLRALDAKSDGEGTCFDELQEADERVAVMKRGQGDQRRDPRKPWLIASVLVLMKAALQIENDVRDGT